MTMTTAAPVPVELEADLRASTLRARNRNTALVWIGRVLVAVVFIGGWQLLTVTGILDKFFYGQPSGIWA
ncbi:hypothetical protein, partial [Amnibacterium sp.]|uniref:hypothetical protein n=1 Tax=Amnibacterium sp. TaxID=1872496 RepID=UPI003F7C6CC7